MELIQMEMVSFYYWINLHHYPLILLIVFLAWKLLKEYRAEIFEYLEALNILSFCLSIYAGLYFSLDVLEMLYFFKKDGLYLDRTLDYYYPWLIFYSLLMLVLAGMLKKNLRRSFAYSLLLSIFISLEVIIIWVSSLHADFLPSTFTFPILDLSTFLMYGLAVSVIYFIKRKWSRGL